MKDLKTFIQMIRRNNYVVLDTETTGLNDAEIVQIAVVHCSGNILLDTHVKPIRPIPIEATRIHGITDKTVEAAPTWADINPLLQALLKDRDVVIYNAAYDCNMLSSATKIAGLPNIQWSNLCEFWCAMLAFAEWYGDWNDYRGSWRWHRLSVAATVMRVKTHHAHSALGDTLTTLGVIKQLAVELAKQSR